MKGNNKAYLHAIGQLEEAAIIYEGLQATPPIAAAPELQHLTLHISAEVFRAKLARRLRLAKRARQLLPRASKALTKNIDNLGKNFFDRQPPETKEALLKHLNAEGQHQQSQKLQEAIQVLITDIDLTIAHFETTISKIDQGTL